MWDLAKSKQHIHRFSTLFPAQNVRDLLSSDSGIDAAIDWCKKTAVTEVYIETNSVAAGAKPVIEAHSHIRR